MYWESGPYINFKNPFFSKKNSADQNMRKFWIFLNFDQLPVVTVLFLENTSIFKCILPKTLFSNFYILISSKLYW